MGSSSVIFHSRPPTLSSPFSITTNFPLGLIYVCFNLNLVSFQSISFLLPFTSLCILKSFSLPQFHSAYYFFHRFCSYFVLLLDFIVFHITVYFLRFLCISHCTFSPNNQSSPSKGHRFQFSYSNSPSVRSQFLPFSSLSYINADTSSVQLKPLSRTRRHIPDDSNL